MIDDVAAVPFFPRTLCHEYFRNNEALSAVYGLLSPSRAWRYDLGTHRDTGKSV